jgi:excisionase family DNA binding protein
MTPQDQTTHNQTNGQTAQSPARLMTLPEVAAYLRVSTATVRRWSTSGVLGSYRPGGKYGRRLFSPEQVQEFLLNRGPAA